MAMRSQTILRSRTELRYVLPYTMVMSRYISMVTKTDLRQLMLQELPGVSSLLTFRNLTQKVTSSIIL